MSRHKMSDRQRIIKELTGVKGIGPKRAARIYDKCGRKTCLEQLEQHPEAVSNKAGISKELVREARDVLKPPAFGKRAGSKGLTSALTEIDDIRREFARHWSALNKQRKYCELVFEKHRDRLIARPDVTGVHVGLWRKAGKIVCPLQYCIRVHVFEKLGLLNDKLLEANSLMPTPLESMIEGVRVDITQQKYRKTMTLPGSAIEHANPIEGGVAISPSDNSDDWGTLGMPVLNLHDGLRRFLTNAHVVKSEDAFVQQPASITPRDNLKIGQVKEDPIQNDTIDAALITPNDSRPSKRRIRGVHGGFISRDLTQADVDVRTEVFKVALQRDLRADVSRALMQQSTSAEARSCTIRFSWTRYRANSLNVATADRSCLSEALTTTSTSLSAWSTVKRHLVTVVERAKSSRVSHQQSD